MNTSTTRRLFCLIATLAVFSTASPCGATIVRIDSIAGKFDVQLFDNAAPATVENFLRYVTHGRYDNQFQESRDNHDEKGI